MLDKKASSRSRGKPDTFLPDDILTTEFSAEPISTMCLKRRITNCLSLKTFSTKTLFTRVFTCLCGVGFGVGVPCLPLLLEGVHELFGDLTLFVDFDTIRDRSAFRRR
jgi:hypothetical protein